MPWIFYILLFFSILIILPIPIKLKLKYINNDVSFYIYNFKINLNKDVKKSTRTVRKGKDKKINLRFNDFKLIAHNIDCSKFKPTLRMNIKLNLGIYNAFTTAIFTGFLYSFSPIIYRFLNIIFKIKHYNLDIKANFEETVLNVYVTGIIFINLAEVIYMLILVLKSLKYIKTLTEYKYNSL